MNQVKVSKFELLSKVIENRETHITEFNESHEAWVQSCKEFHIKQIESLQKHNKELDINKPLRPHSYANDYDRVIAMLNMSVDAEITLTSKEFEQYVMDNWAWSESFKSLASSYKGV